MRSPKADYSNSINFHSSNWNVLCISDFPANEMVVYKQLHTENLYTISPSIDFRRDLFLWNNYYRERSDVTIGCDGAWNHFSNTLKTFSHSFIDIIQIEKFNRILSITFTAIIIHYGYKRSLCEEKEQKPNQWPERICTWLELNTMLYIGIHAMECCILEE